MKTTLPNNVLIHNSVYTFKNKRGEVEEQIIHENVHEALVSYDTFTKARKEVERRNTVVYRTPKEKKLHSYLQGLTKCASCGWTLSFRKRKDRTYTEILPCKNPDCTNRVSTSRVEKVEEIVEATLKGLIPYIEAKIKEYDTGEITKVNIRGILETEIEKIKKNIQKNKNKLEKLTEKYIEELISDEIYISMKKKYEGEGVDLKTALKGAYERLDGISVQNDKESYSKLLHTIENFSDVSKEEQLTFIHSIINNIEYERHIVNQSTRSNSYEVNPIKLNITFREDLL